MYKYLYDFGVLTHLINLSYISNVCKSKSLIYKVFLLDSCLLIEVTLFILSTSVE
ncbi:hypothetical protein FM106_07325 [Brachybacterium faecium]|nr:hypothetical protein FM106_07325 [Brachybacterium faecium]